jgi:4-hydroxythreonine-4-phosphate dehydrogenase
MMERPIVATMIGDPAGIGPEVIARALVDPSVREASRPLLVGSAEAMQRALGFTGLSHLKIRVLRSADEPLSDDAQTIDIVDSGALAGVDLPLGEDTLVGGEASAVWLDETDAIARAGIAAATIMGPISTGSLKLAGKLGKVISPTPGESYLLLITGPLRIAHLTDHMPLRQVCDAINADLVDSALCRLDEALKSWGIASPRIVVAGLNPHAMGDEDRNEIAPGVARARAQGVNAEGPVSPDSVFRQCIEGRYDMVLAMCHDQGHIAVKTWGFSGNCAIILGPPYLHMSVAHGTAYDIVGTGRADPAMMVSAMRTAGYLAAGRGFPPEPR